MLTATSVENTVSAAQPNPGHRNFPVRIERVVVIAVFAALAARLLTLISRYAVNVFFMDQWEFNEVTLFQKHSLWAMFRWQHGPHRQGLGALFAILVEPHFRWDSRTESFLVGAVVILAAACALWLKHRLFGGLAIFDVCIPLILLTPLQYETLFITANFAHGPLPLLLILLSCLAWTISNRILRLALILLLNFLAIHTGFGFFLGVLTPFLLTAEYWLKPGNRDRLLFLVSLLLSVASLAFFFVNYHFDSSVDCAPNIFHSPLAYAQFLWLMFANLFGAKGTGFLPVLVGIVTFAATIASLAATVVSLRWNSNSEEDRTKYLVIALLLGFCLLFSANASYGRSCLGIQVAQVSRYVIYMECGLLGLYFFLLTWSRSAIRASLLILLTAALLGTIPVRWQDRAIMNFIRYAKANWKRCYIQFEEIRGCNHAVGYGVYPNTDRDLKGKLEFLKQTKQNLYAAQ